MSKHLISALLFSFAFAVAAPAEGSVEVGDQIKFGNGVGSPGGIFHIDNLTNGAGYDFDTFCVELEEFISFNKTYAVEGISQVTRQTGRQLGSFSAWLYTEYLNGTLSGFTPTAANANTLQFGIWNGMGYDQSDFNTYVGGNFYTTYNSLLSATTWEEEYKADVIAGTWSGTGNISVMNLRRVDPITGRYTGYAQDQLVQTPVPEPGTIVVWSVLSLIAAGVVIRTKKKTS